MRRIGWTLFSGADMESLINYHKRGGDMTCGLKILFEKRANKLIECSLVDFCFNEIEPDYTGVESYHKSTVNIFINGKTQRVPFTMLYVNE